MPDGPRFRADLYRGTASFYDRFRLPYPPPLIGDLIDRTSLSGRRRLLDLACGTGQVAFALRHEFDEVWAVDQEAEMIEFAVDRAVRLGVGNIRWITQRAEAVDVDGTFVLVTVGNAFHRLRRRLVADRAMQWLREGGYLALLWCSTPQNGTAPWQRALDDCAQEWMRRVGETDRLPLGLAEEFAHHPHVSVLAEAGFSIIGRYEFAQEHEWTVDDLIGFVYSTSLLPRSALGEHVTEFEADLEQRLHAAEPSGVYREHVTAAYDLAFRSPRRALNEVSDLL